MFATLHHSCEQEIENIFNDINSVLMVYTFCKERILSFERESSG
jgi:hypothetical protein